MPQPNLNLWSFMDERNRRPERTVRPRIALDPSLSYQDHRPTEDFNDPFAADTPPPVRLNLASSDDFHGETAPEEKYYPNRINLAGAPPVATQEPTPTSQINLSDSFDQAYSQGTPAEPMPTDPATAPIALTPLQQEQANLDKLSNPKNPDYEKPKNNDKGFWGRAWDIVRESIIGAGQTWDRNSNVQDPQARLMAALGGGIAGGFRGGFDPSIDERRKREGEIGQSRIRLGEMTELADADAKRGLVQAQTQLQLERPEIERAKIAQRDSRAKMDFEARKATHDRLVKAEQNKGQRAASKYSVKEVDGYLYRVYNNDPSKEMEAIIDPRTGKQATNPANVAQEIVFEDGTRAMAKGGQIVAGKFAGERQAAQQDFQRTENQTNRVFQSTLESAKMQFRSAMKQMDVASGRQKTLEHERSKFVAAYKKANNSEPSEEEIQKYMETVTGILDEPDE